MLRQTYTPQDLNSHTIALEVTSNDPAAPATQITLTGSGATPQPIDSLLVLDRSGSMSDLAGDRTKIEAMRDAVMLYTDLLRPRAAASRDRRPARLRQVQRYEQRLHVDDDDRAGECRTAFATTS